MAKKKKTTKATRASRREAALQREQQDEATMAELRERIKRLERQNSKLRTNEDLIKHAVDGVLTATPRTFSVPPKRRKTGRRKKLREIAILHLSDIQLGKITKSYDTDVAEKRVLEAVRKACYIADLRRSRAEIDELRIYWGGDVIEGEDIFPHQAHEIDSPLYDQACVNFPRIAVKANLIALEAFDRVANKAVWGNHGRNGPRNTRSSPKTNWDRVAYHTTRLTLLGSEEHPRDDFGGRLTFDAPEDFYLVDRVFGWGNLLVHGHQISGGFAGFPWYGAGKKAWGWADALDEPWDNLFFGHFHTPAMFTLGRKRVYANGTTESDNEFAKEQLASAGLACQRLLFMDEEHGVISDDLLYLEPASPCRNVTVTP